MIIKAIAGGVVWVLLVVGADYLMTGMNNDAIDALFGQIAGFGFGAIVVLGFVLTLKKKRAQTE